MTYYNNVILTLCRYCTLVCIVSWVAKQILHFRNAKPTPILNPPTSWAANVSAKNATTVPQKWFSIPLASTVIPSYEHTKLLSLKNATILCILTVYNWLTSWMNGFKTWPNPYFRNKVDLMTATSWIQRWVHLSAGLRLAIV